MKILKNSIVISLFLVLINCNSQQNGISSSSEPKTNAEISVKEGGKWNNRKYEGGTFKNVQSLTLDPQEISFISKIHHHNYLPLSDESG